MINTHTGLSGITFPMKNLEEMCLETENEATEVVFNTIFSLLLFGGRGLQRRT